ncbi:E3 ubiquitin-protein ligase KEG isoform X2 [Rosa chinensis]|uniref:E3 ubiquitin-protein ligase KEG isoform X2 n=1 Tax=Rosa chinensis TaxID=74649 RepID=UPI001AD9019D|nr:E3 ubiquitin-protein ligase KEG isoform X2 [Rosa chinensis]
MPSLLWQKLPCPKYNPTFGQMQIRALFYSHCRALVSKIMNFLQRSNGSWEFCSLNLLLHIDVGRLLTWSLLVHQCIYSSRMEQQIAKEKPAISFEYELFQDPDHLTTVVATLTPTSPRINPASLNFKYRIGQGPFGDVWLATHHQSADDYDEYHEVAVKMLHPLMEEDREKFLHKFEKLFFKFRRLCGVCWFHGISIIDGRICIAMKFYEGSVGDRVARLKGGKLQLFDVLRYGIELAKGISELHSLGLLVLNLKPSNILVDEHGQVVLGDFGIPFLLLGASLSNPNMAFRLGTPNYMAPEQWEPEVRGPISLETDSWGFGCCFVEMLTGSQPWFGSSIKEIYHSVVIKREKPPVPSGLPPAVENVINGCFEYDLHNRPSMEDIIRALESVSVLLLQVRVSLGP